MLKAIQQGIITTSTKQRLEELEKTKSQLEISILQEQIEKPMLTKEQMLFWLHKFRNLDISDRDSQEHLIECFINAIYVYDDRIVLTFNYKDSTISISLDDLESSDLESPLLR